MNWFRIFLAPWSYRTVANLTEKTQVKCQEQGFDKIQDQRGINTGRWHPPQILSAY